MSTKFWDKNPRDCVLLAKLGTSAQKFNEKDHQDECFAENFWDKLLFTAFIDLMVDSVVKSHWTKLHAYQMLNLNSFLQASII